MKKCLVCLYSAPANDAGEFFECRFNPPVVPKDQSIGITAGRFPIVRSHWWCGRFEPDGQKLREQVKARAYER